MLRLVPIRRRDDARFTGILADRNAGFVPSLAVRIPNPLRPPIARPDCLVVASAVVLAVCSPGPVSGPNPVGAIGRPPLHVAIGDSFTAGPFVPEPIGHPPGCLRSARNWARLLAARTDARLRDASCTGARVADLTRRQRVVGGTNPAQLGRVDADVTLVTIQLGGNDLGFGAILLRCFALLPVGSPCRDRYVRNGVDDLADRITRLAPRIGTAIETVRRRAPRARLALVGYPTILPDTGPGCWPRLPFTPADVAYLRSVHRRLDRALATEATRHGATWIGLSGPSVGHDACAPAPQRWVEPIVPAVPAAPVHPNAAGMAAFAGIVAHRLAGVS